MIHGFTDQLQQAQKSPAILNLFKEDWARKSRYHKLAFSKSSGLKNVYEKSNHRNKAAISNFSAVMWPKYTEKDSKSNKLNYATMLHTTLNK